MIERQKRLKEVYEYVRENCHIHTKTQFAESVQFGRTSISAAFNGKNEYLTDNLFKSICAAFPGVFNIDYLLNGEGTLLLDKVEPVRYVDERKGIPYFNVDFAAGFNIMENDQTTLPAYYIDFRPYNDCDCWCNAHGNSMYPTIASGDIVAMKEIKDFQYLINGEIYGIVTTNGLRTIKRIRDNGKTITLIPDNKSVAEQTIPKNLLAKVFLIKGCLKKF